MFSFRNKILPMSCDLRSRLVDTVDRHRGRSITSDRPVGKEEVGVKLHEEFLDRACERSGLNCRSTLH